MTGSLDHYDVIIICVDPARAMYPNFTLLMNAYATRLETDAAGRSVSCVHVLRDNGRSPAKTQTVSRTAFPSGTSSAIRRGQ